VNNLGDLLKEIFKRTGVYFVILGILLLLVAANGSIPFVPNARPFETYWVIILGVLGGFFILIGVIISIRDRQTSTSVPEKITGPSVNALDQSSIQKLRESGLTRSFRIPVDNGIRLERVCYLIDEEVQKGTGHLRLTASSGHSYLHPSGPVWQQAGLSQLIGDGKVKFDVVLESPFSSFAETRALANKVHHNHWDERQLLSHLVELLKYTNFNCRVTSEAITCSLFLTSRAVYFDPYLWALPSPSSLERTENKFWVFEFDKVIDPRCVNLDCYKLLEKHFDFIYQNGIPLEQFLYKPEAGRKPISRERFLTLFQEDPDQALIHYKRSCAEFNDLISPRLKG